MNAQTKIDPQTQVATRLQISELCKFRGEALEKMRECAVALGAAYAIGEEASAKARRATMGRGIGGALYASEHDTAYGALFKSSKFDVEVSMEDYRKNLDRGVWTQLLETTGIQTMMDATALKELRQSISDDVPEASEANVRATIETLFADADMIFSRGLVNCFAKLDRRFKSHDGFKIGGRIIIDRAFSEMGGNTNYGSTWDTIADVERVLAVLDDKNPEGSAVLRAKVDADRTGTYGPMQSQTETDYFRIDGFKNGNAHLWFTRDDLVKKANQILGDHYGEVLPDAYQGGDDSDLFNKSNVPAKDLQFYPTPSPAVIKLLDGLHLSEGAKVLEPSAGQGAIALEAARLGANVTAIEINPDHCAVLKSRASQMAGSGSIRLKQANFLAVTPSPTFDFILMNPPFYGTHYMDHVKHAFEFLSAGGMLRAILPASAEVNESRKHSAFRKWAMEHNDLGWAGPFRDLPAESFKDSGTMIQTVVLHLRKRR
jgi:predicted RNA methylase